MLLHNILPTTIVQELKEHRCAIAKTYASVTVLFADVVSFTTMSAQTPHLFKWIIQFLCQSPGMVQKVVVVQLAFAGFRRSRCEWVWRARDLRSQHVHINLLSLTLLYG